MLTTYFIIYKQCIHYSDTNLSQILTILKNYTLSYLIKKLESGYLWKQENQQAYGTDDNLL